MRDYPLRASAEESRLTSSSAPATFLFLGVVITAFVLLSVLRANPHAVERRLPLPQTSAPQRQAAGEGLYILVVSGAQAQAIAAGSLPGRYEVWVVASHEDEEALQSALIEVNGYRWQSGLPEARVIDLR